jgi:hypothetical protein
MLAFHPRNSFTSQQRLRFSSKQSSSNVRTKNAVMALSIATFVGVVYYTAINKMRQDDLEQVIREKEEEKNL